MLNRVCDRCGQPLEEGALRYVARIQVYAAYDPLQITFEDLEEDHEAKIRQILEACQNMSEEELMRDVYVEFSFDLCPPCQKAYIKDPLPMPK